MPRPDSPYWQIGSAWAGATPSAGPFGAPENLGWWFTLDIDTKVAGFAWFTDGRSPDFVLFQLWDATRALVAEQAISGKESKRVPAGPGWRNIWVHPRPRLIAGAPYLVNANLTSFSANFGALVAAPIVNGHITVLRNGTSPQSANGVYEADTDTSGRFAFVNPPNDPTVGHWYAVDVLFEIP